MSNSFSLVETEGLAKIAFADLDALKDAFFAQFPQHRTMKREFLSWYRWMAKDAAPVGNPDPTSLVDPKKFELLRTRLKNFLETGEIYKKR
jgi:hypothetical protein